MRTAVPDSTGDHADSVAAPSSSGRFLLPQVSSPSADLDRPKPPGTLPVLLLLVLADAAFSYLWAYGLTDALKSAQVMSDAHVGSDPRPRWMATAITGVMAVFLTAAILLRLMSQRHMRRIDSMEGDE